MTHECGVCGNLLNSGYPCGRCGHDPLSEERKFAFDGGHEVADTDHLLASTRTYLEENLGLVEELAERLDGNDEGRALFAADGLTTALAHLEKIGEDDADVSGDVSEPTNGGERA